MMKDRKKMAAELHHRKQEGNGTSMIFGRKVPVIKEVYDPLTGLRNGTITPNAPVSDKGTLIHVKRVFKYTDTEVLVILPNLEPGEYSPVMMIHTGDKVDFTYTLPVSWKVLDERYVNLFVRRSCSDLI